MSEALQEAEKWGNDGVLNSCHLLIDLFIYQYF